MRLAMFDKIQARLTERGIEPETFRANLKSSQQTWNGWRNGTVAIGLCALLAMCDALDLSLLRLLTGDGKESTAACLARVVAHLPEAERAALTQSAQALARFYQTSEETVCEN